MEDTLRALFDYQKFQDNKELRKVVESVKVNELTKLDEADLELINAAGDIVETTMMPDAHKIFNGELSALKK